MVIDSTVDLVKCGLCHRDVSSKVLAKHLKGSILDLVECFNIIMTINIS